MMDKLKIALIHDWLTGMRGGEKCLEALCEIFPEADIFTLLWKRGSVSRRIEAMKINTSFIQKLPFLGKYRHYLPLFPTAIELFDLSDYDLVISVSHCVAKGVITRPDTLHICYCLTPMRYVWDMYHSYFGEVRGGRIYKSLIPIFANYLRMWDVGSSIRVEYFIAISTYIANRILKYYGRQADVVYPPVDCSLFKPSERVDDYYLMVTAFAPYKRVDLAIHAFNSLKLPFVIIGTGQDEKRLKNMAGDNIEFLGWQSDETIRDYYSRCKALIFPGVEDFGIVPLEAQACGRPVIAYGLGGICETVLPVNLQQGLALKQPMETKDTLSPTGIFFYEQTATAIINAVKEFEKIQDIFDSANIRKHAVKFDMPIFKEKIKVCIERRYYEYIRTKRS